MKNAGVNKEIGNLFVCEEHYILLYESKKVIENAFADGAAREIAAATKGIGSYTASAFVLGVAGYWSNVLGSDVRPIGIKTPMLFLEKDGPFQKVLVGEKIGWIFISDWFDIKPLKHDE